MKSVLVVDDLGICRSLIEKQLHILGVENVDFAFNGKEAIGKVKTQKYDLVFMDINMPVMDGLTATKIIRNSDNSYMQNLPIIVLTSNCLQGDAKKSFDAGCTEHIVKPLELSRLKEILEKWLPE